MEAAAIFETASLFVHQEQIQVLKVISDNNKKLDHISKQQVIDLMRNHLAEIDDLVNYLHALSLQLAPTKNSKLFHIVTENWHFSTYQKHQLQEITRRWNIHLADTDILSVLKDAQDANAVIRQLTLSLNNANYSW